MPPKEEKKDEKKGGKDEKKAGKGGKAKATSTKVKKIVEKEPPGKRRYRRKHEFSARLIAAMGKYKNCIVAGIDNVASNQLQKVRLALRKSNTIMLVGKNTVVRKILRDNAAKTNAKWLSLVDEVANNVALIFTNTSDLSSIRDVVTQNKIPAAAKVGVVAPIDVYVPAGPTPLDPGQTSFFQALNIATKITRGAIEIINQVHLVKVGDLVTASAVALLSKLNLKPFFYGITVNKVYEDGFLYDGSVLDMDKSAIYDKFLKGVQILRHLSLAINYSNPTTVCNSLVKGHNILLKICLNFPDYSFPTAEPLRASLGMAKKEEPKAEAKEDGAKEDGAKSDKGGKSDKSAKSSSSSGSD